MLVVMDIAAIVGNVIAVASAVFAGWQALEAKKSRRTAELSQKEAAESSGRAARSAEIAAEAQRKLAEAQRVMSDIAKRQESANRRNVRLEHSNRKLYVVVNDTGETITNVEVRPTREDQERFMRDGTAERLEHGDRVEVLLPFSGIYKLRWVDSDGDKQTKSVNVPTSGA